MAQSRRRLCTKGPLAWGVSSESCVLGRQEGRLDLQKSSRIACRVPKHLLLSVGLCQGAGRAPRWGQRAVVGSQTSAAWPPALGRRRFLTIHGSSWLLKGDLFLADCVPSGGRCL